MEIKQATLELDEAKEELALSIRQYLFKIALVRSFLIARNNPALATKIAEIQKLEATYKPFLN